MFSYLRNWTRSESDSVAEDQQGLSKFQSSHMENEESAGETAGARTTSTAGESRIINSAIGENEEYSPEAGEAPPARSMRLLAPAVPRERHSFSISGRIFSIDKKYKPIKKMGSGAYGVVITALDQQTNQKVAIKKIENVFDNLHDAKRILREVKLMQHFSHKNVLRLVDMIEPPAGEEFNDVYMVTEAMQSDLHRIIYSDNVLSDDHTQYVVYQILCGLKHLHSANVIHRDLKPANILINEDCSVKICDFGLSRGVQSQVKEDLGQLTEYVVTRWYRAPEVITAAQNYGYEIDIWSVGCIMAEIINREPIFQGTSYVDQLNTIFNVIGTPTESDLETCTNAKAVKYISKLQKRAPVDLARILPAASANAVDLLTKMLTFDPRKRITVDEALNHPYFDAWRTADAHECPTAFDFSFEEQAHTRPQLEYQLMEETLRFRPDVFTEEVEARQRKRSQSSSRGESFSRKRIAN